MSHSRPSTAVLTSTSQSFLFRPANQEQADAAEAFRSSDIQFLLGGAGTGKTHLALALATSEILAGRANRILLSRPMVACGEDMGYLPGTVEEKTAPWLLPFSDVLRRLTVQKPEDFLAAHVEVVPLPLVRGRTFDRCVAILSEAQNATLPQLRAFLTRIGDRGRLIIEGDCDQADIRHSCLADVASKLQSLPGVSVCQLDSPACVRHALIPKILSRLK